MCPGGRSLPLRGTSDDGPSRSSGSQTISNRMSQPDGADHWAELASQLGADLPAADRSSPGAGADAGPGAADRPDSATEAPACSLGSAPSSSDAGPKPESAKPVSKPAKRKPISSPPTRSAADWDLLAEELGIAPRPSSGEGSLGKIASRVEWFETPESPEPPVAEAPAAESPPEELGQGPPSGGFARAVGRSPRGEPRAFAPPEPPAGERPSTPGEPCGHAEDASRGGSTQQPTGFGAGLFEAEPPMRREAREEVESESPESRPKRRRRRKKKTRGHNGPSVSDRVSTAEPGAEPGADASSAGDAQPARGIASSRTVSDLPDTRDEGGEPVSSEDAAAPREPADDDRLADEDDDDKEARFIHRGVPTWSEAIGLIIDANMEARAKRPNGTGGSRGRGGRRGRNSGHKG